MVLEAVLSASIIILVVIEEALYTSYIFIKNQNVFPQILEIFAPKISIQLL